MGGLTLEIQGTPVAIAAIATVGIVAIAYSPIQGEAKILAIGALGQLAGGAAGVAVPRGPSQRRPLSLPNLGEAPAAHPPEWGEGG
jgi:hypothetical protein